MNSRKFFLTVLEAEKSHIQVSSRFGAWREPLPGSETAVRSRCPHWWCGLFHKGTHPARESSTLMSSSRPQRPRILAPSHGIGAVT